MSTASLLKKIIRPNDCVFAIGLPLSRDAFFADMEADNKDFAKKIAKIGGWTRYENEIISIIGEVESVMKDTGVTIIHNLTLNIFGKLFQKKNFDIIILLTHWKHESNNAFFTGEEYLEFLDRHPDFLEFIVHAEDLLEWLIQSNNSIKALAEAKLSEQKKGKKTPLVHFVDERVYANYDDIVFHHLKDLRIETFFEFLKHSNTSKIEFHDGYKPIYSIIEQIPIDSKKIIDLNICRSADLATALRKCRPDCHIKYKFDTKDGNDKSNGVIARYVLHFYKALFIYLKNFNLSYKDALENVSSKLMQSTKVKKGGKLEGIN